MKKKCPIILGCLFIIACLVIAAFLGILAARTIPGVARLMAGAPIATASREIRTTTTLLLATLTPAPVPTLPDPGPAHTVAVSPSVSVSPTQTGTLPPIATPEPAESTPTRLAYTVTPKDEQRAPTATPSPLGWIAFETQRGEFGDYEIFVTSPDGSRLMNLTNSWADDLAPVWSPDGRHIAFVSLRDTVAGKWGLGPGSIYVMGFDPNEGVGDGNAIRVTDPESNDGWPTWSPDGQRLAFHSDRSGNWEIWSVNLDGSGLANLTNHPADDRFPAWSPELPKGERIAFTSKRSGNLDVWTMTADGSDPVNLTNSPGRDQYPMWSPDGTRLTFNTKRGGNFEIYIMNADGSSPTNVSNSPGSTEGLADWSPSGGDLVLYSDRPGNKDLFIVSLSGGPWTNITNHPASDEFCTWSP